MLTSYVSSIQYGNITINFTVYPTSRRSTVTIYIKPNLEVNVRVPKKSTIKSINDVVHKKAPWIIKKWDYFKKLNLQIPSTNYINNEPHLYLGKSYKLNILKGTKNNITVTPEYLFVESTNPDNELLTKHLLKMWYWKQAKEFLTNEFNTQFENFNNYGLVKPTLMIKPLRGKWGQCSTKGIIKLNEELIKFSLECIHYVMIHEFCHLIEHNHGKNFYKILNIHMPEWKRIKRELDKTGYTIY